MTWKYIPRDWSIMRPNPYWKFGEWWVFESSNGWRIVGSPKFVGLTFQRLGMAFLFAEQIPQPEPLT